MGTKINPGKFDCYNNALADEPMFILLGRDQSAPLLVEQWALNRLRDIEAGIRPETDRAMATEAYECAQAMQNWRAANLGKWRAPNKIGP